MLILTGILGEKVTFCSGFGLEAPEARHGMTRIGPSDSLDTGILCGEGDVKFSVCEFNEEGCMDLTMWFHPSCKQLVFDHIGDVSS